MKRQLESKYKKIVDCINNAKQNDNYLGQILRDYLDGFGSLGNMFTELDLGDTWSSDDTVIPIITDIYFDNYELQQPKHMYRLADINSDKGAIYLTLKDDYYTLQVWSYSTNKYQELTDKQFQEFLSQHTKFTADMFEKMEV